MCGIAGVVYRQREHGGGEAVLTTMCAAIAHRGPDDMGTLVEAGTAIGMRRLSIIDLAGGHQPVFNETGRIAVVLNGEIYNFRELREELLAAGHTFRTHSDTEVIVHLYEEHGAACVSRLRGMFAFAVWNAERDELLLARDRFGIKPLYVAEDGTRIAFASELKALVAAGQTTRTLDSVSLDIFLQLGYIPAPRTPFADVIKLMPGETLLWSRHRPSVRHRYWTAPEEEQEPVGDLSETIRTALDDSVRAHLVSDVPIAAFLSGGIDSSAVVSSMALQGYAVHAFTARYTGSGAEASDESQLATALANKYGASLTVVDIHPNVRDLMEPICIALDEPLADESAIPSWIISQEVARSYKVVMAGSGGDELFGGYRRHRAAMAGARYQRVPAPLRRAAAGVASMIREPESGALGVSRMKRFLRSSGGSADERYASYMVRITDDELRELRGPAARPGSFIAPIRAVPGADVPSALRRALLVDYSVYLPDDVLAVSDRISSAHSLEMRVPFVDHLLVETLLPLPDGFRIRGGQQKWALRQAVAERLTPAHMTAPKRGFVGPMASWLRNELRGMLRDELSAARLERLGLFDAQVVQRWIREHQSRTHNREGILWALLSFSIWHRAVVEV